ncbi:MAG: hypothetical protein AAFW68_13805, partial [Pseudomonadota bacterium]
DFHRYAPFLSLRPANHSRAFVDDQPKIIFRSRIKKKFPVGLKAHSIAKQISFTLPPPQLRQRCGRQ